jgi:hypothetical protein
LCWCVVPLAPALRSTDSAAFAPADASAVGFLRFGLAPVEASSDAERPTAWLGMSDSNSETILDRLRGWACETRTQKRRRKLSL